MVKELTGDSWNCWHGTFAGTEKILLNGQGAKISPSTAFGDFTPSSTIFKVRGSNTNNSSTGYVAYCWTEIDGYSKFGSYKGNLNGGFVYTGFRPAFVMIKSSSTGSTDWVMYDNLRDPFNIGTSSNTLYANQNSVEGSAGGLDFLSNGFKLRSSNGFNNNSSRTYIYMSWAEHPFVGDGTNPVTAR